MALEWIVLGTAAGAEAIMLLLLTLPGLDRLRHGFISAAHSTLRSLLAVIPFCLFLMMDIYWKYETQPTCEHGSLACTAVEHQRHQKSIMKSQRNALLIVATLLFYWLLFAVTSLVARLDQLSKRASKLDRSD
jgi:predicted anti-sigma-YlaC factor YlaD